MLARILIFSLGLGGVGVAQTVTVAVSPTTATNRVGETRAFAATVRNTVNTTVTWTTTTGSITSAGVFTAPATLPLGGLATGRATSVADPTKFAMADVSLQNARPTITSLNPTSVNTGVPYTLLIVGSNFLPTSTVTVEGVSAAVTYLGPTGLQVSAVATNLPGNAIDVIVSNPDTGASSSGMMGMTVLAAQQQQWQSGTPRGSAPTGWAGRIADQVRVMNAPSQFPTGVSVNGNSLFLIGQDMRPSQIASTNLDVLGQQNRAADVDRQNALQQILTMSTGATLVQAAGQRINDSLAVLRQADAAFKALPTLMTVFPTTSIGNQLRQVARLIQIRGQVGLRRQIFFCSQGGYDTHEAQAPTHARLLLEMNDAVLAFNRAMEELGLGGHQIVTGGAVRSGIYGVFPQLILDDPDDSGSRGNWIPTTSLDEYGATLAKWFGVPESAMGTVFPNLANFGMADLGFLG